MSNKAFQNANGTGQTASAPMDADEKAFKCAVKECDQMQVSKDQKETMKASDDPCKTLGRFKHQCVADKVKDRKNCASESAWDTGVNPPKRLMRKFPNHNKPCTHFTSAWASMRRQLGRLKQVYQKGRMRMPDFIIGKPPRKILDAKFPCSDDLAKGKLHSGSRFPSAAKPGVWREGQKEAYQKILGKGGAEPETVAPKDVENLDCS
jgi:hypothetical protein